MATGETGKAVDTLEMMRTIYPRSAPVHNTLGELYVQTGQLEKAEPSFREAIRLTRHPNAYGGLAWTCFRLNRPKEAKDVIAEARQQGVDNRDLRHLLYLIAFGEGDRATMVQQAQWARGKQEEAFMLALQGNAAAYAGRLEEAREFFRQAVSTAQRRDLKNAAADFTADAARWEACSGNCDRALEYVSSPISSGADSRIMLRSALTLALCDKSDEAEALVDRVDAEYATHTALQQVSLPVVRAAIALSRGEPSAALKALGMTSQKAAGTALWPRYLAAEACRRLGSHAKARAEYKYVLKHRCLEALSPLCTLARLGLARSEAASGDNAGSGKTYQELFAHWNHADPDIPIFRQAIAEYSSQRRAQP
jgi:tetratricopeptide (TPR) repeat protein